jgi:hypothetical protein
MIDVEPMWQLLKWTMILILMLWIVSGTKDI